MPSETYSDDWTASEHGSSLNRRISTFSTLSVATALPLYAEDDDYYPPGSQHIARTCASHNHTLGQLPEYDYSEHCRSPSQVSVDSSAAWTITSPGASSSSPSDRTSSGEISLRSNKTWASSSEASFRSSSPSTEGSAATIGSASSRRSSGSRYTRETSRTWASRDTAFPAVYNPAASIFHRTPTTEHTFSLRSDKGNGDPWATLVLSSNAKSSDNTPHYYAGNKIRGVLHFSLQDHTTIRMITVTLRGTIVQQRLQSNHSHNFLEETVSIWSKDSYDSRVPSTSGSVIGLFAIPFEMQFPTTMDLKGDNNITSNVPLPESMQEHNSPITLEYKLIVTIQKGRFQSPARLITDVIYTPRVTPTPYTSARQFAYSNSRAIPGPITDPKGWLITAPMQCPGNLRGIEDVMISGTVFLPSPASYTRGTAVPCKIHVNTTTTRNISIEDLVSLRLCRRVIYLDPKAGRKKRLKDCTDKLKVDIGSAIWFGSRPKGRTVTLEGELHIHEELPASATFPLFTIEYFIVLLAFKSDEFTPLDPKPLMKRKIEVATELPEGPTPTRPVTPVPVPKWLSTEYDSMTLQNYF